MSRKIQIFIVAVIAAIFIMPTAADAARGTVTDNAGQTYNVASLKLQRGRQMRVVCGDTRIAVPFNRIRAMKIDQSQITSYGGDIHFGVEIQMRRDGTTIGNILERGRCLIHAGNGLRGKVAGSRYNAPFSNVSSVAITGRGDAAAAGEGEDDEEEE